MRYQVHDWPVQQFLMINIGGYMAKQGQVFWPGKTCVAFIPETQVLDGHVIVTNLSEAYQYAKWSVDEVKESARMKSVINRVMCEHLKAQSTTIYLQLVDQNVWKKTVIHIIPRYKADLVNNDEIYKILDKYHLRLIAANRSNEDESSLLKTYQKSQQFKSLVQNYI